MRAPKKKSVSPGPRDREATRARLIEAVGTLLARQGFTALGVNAVAREAGVDKVLIYRYFGGMPGLTGAYAREGDFWPSLKELAGGDVNAFIQLPLPERLAQLTHNFIAAIRKRPITLEIMAWEMVERNELTEELEAVREASGLKMLELFLPPAETGADLAPLMILAGAALTYLVIRARKIQWYSGLDLNSEASWRQLEEGIREMVQGILETRGRHDLK
jgi:AcrR family transcriptional regulator